jgi:2-iminobutanoate/2-iminopropanoate deaminase
VAEKSVVRTESAPAPFQGAPYSQAIRVGDLVFVSGQLALRPGEKELSGGSIQEQTDLIFQNLEAILAEAGSGLDKLVKTTVFLQSLDDFAGMSELRRRPSARPLDCGGGAASFRRARRDRRDRAPLTRPTGRVVVDSRLRGC